jgi:NAD(P)-dependent dehydrogenase (short-subunit alcohol dehydrogenase family)
MTTVLITGANRGLGYEYTRQLLARDWDVIAGTRKPDADSLAALSERYGKRLRIRALDVTDHTAVEALAAEFADTPLDLVVNNAGSTGPKGAPECMEYSGLTNMDFGIWRDILEINLVGAFKVATAFHSHLAAADDGILVNMSSDLGSCEQNTQGGLYSYRSTKAGLNILTKGMANEWQDVITIAMAPGWCQTDLGGADAEVPPAESVNAQLDTLARLTPEDSGRFIDRFGETVPW